MTVYNHIAGGTVFTGAFCSLFNLNIFENKYTIALTIISCILPDIDHTKSLIGKLFFPLSKYLSVRFGHRTLTHSLIFFIPLIFIVSFLEKTYFDGGNYYLIFLFGFSSHLILDMVTIQGIPLFYPFNKNPCVIPANPDLRLRTGDIKTEGIMLFIFSILTFTLQPLFINGFWSNYNKSFNTIEHVYREYNNSNQVLEVSYNYKYFGNDKIGKGYLIQGKKNELKILKKNKITSIKDDENTIIKILNFRKTDSILKSKEIIFSKIKTDSLNKLFINEYIISSNIYSSIEMKYQGKKTNFFEIENSYNPKGFENIETENKELILLNNNIHKEKLIIQKTRFQKNKIKKRISEINSLLKSANSYENDKLITELNRLKKKNENINIDHSELNSLLHSKTTFPKKTDLNFTGKITYLKIFLKFE